MLDQWHESLVENKTRTVKAEEFEVLARLIARVDWAPHCARPGDAKDAENAIGLFADRMVTFSPECTPE